jgi:hypothetical protein
LLSGLGAPKVRSRLTLRLQELRSTSAALAAQGSMPPGNSPSVRNHSLYQLNSRNRQLKGCTESTSVVGRPGPVDAEAVLRVSMRTPLPGGTGSGYRCRVGLSLLFKSVWPLSNAPASRRPGHFLYGRCRCWTGPR